LRGFYLDSFEAEAKRSWFSLREALGAALKGGKLWVPVVVTIVEGRVRISTGEGAVEFRPRRLRWTAPDSFVLSGLDKGLTFRRSYLRFKGHEDASQAASILGASSSLTVEALTPVEEFPVHVRFLVSAGYLMLQLYVLLYRLFVAAIVLVILGSFGTIGLILGIALVIGYFGLFFWTVLVKDRRGVEGWLRFEGRSIAVRTRTQWVSIFPKIIEWKSPTVFTIRGLGTKLEITFPANQDATQIASKIKAIHPNSREIPVEVRDYLKGSKND
jgi:hypothetical protein